MLVSALSSIKFNNISQSKLTARTPLTFKGMSDSFVKTSPKKNENEFISWADRKDLADVIKKSLQNPENKIGKGFYNCAYKIEGNDNFIFRVSNFSKQNLDFTNIEIKDTEDKELKVNIGQQVAEITLKSGNDTLPEMRIEVLKKQTGKSLGVPPPEVFNDDNGNLKTGELPYDDISKKEQYFKSLEILSKMPLEAYEKLIDTIQKAGERGLLIDYYNSNNILLDEENQSINVIDMDKRPGKPDWGNVLYALTNIVYFNSVYNMTFNPKEEAVKASEHTVEIINKFTRAMQNKHVKFDKTNYTFQFQNFLESIPAKIFCNSFSPEGEWAKFEQLGIA